MSSGAEVFDDVERTKAYHAWRHRPNSPNKSIEEPIIVEMLGDVQAESILDLGCGDGTFGLELLDAGCQSYLGVEISQEMVRAAQGILADTSSQIVQNSIESWSYPPEQFGLVISRLVLHYVADLDAAFSNVYATLKSGGRFVFSIVHPVITSSDKSRKGGGIRQDWIVDNYFEAGTRQVFMMGEYIEQYHRTVEDIFGALQGAGFIVEQLREACPKKENFTDMKLYERRKRIPLFLFFEVRKA